MTHATLKRLMQWPQTLNVSRSSNATLRSEPQSLLRWIETSLTASQVNNKTCIVYYFINHTSETVGSCILTKLFVLVLLFDFVGQFGGWVWGWILSGLPCHKKRVQAATNANTTKKHRTQETHQQGLEVHTCMISYCNLWLRCTMKAVISADICVWLPKRFFMKKSQTCNCRDKPHKLQINQK